MGFSRPTERSQPPTGQVVEIAGQRPFFVLTQLYLLQRLERKIVCTSEQEDGSLTDVADTS
jgi:hypothetical protein